MAGERLGSYANEEGWIGTKREMVADHDALLYAAKWPRGSLATLTIRNLVNTTVAFNQELDLSHTEAPIPTHEQIFEAVRQVEVLFSRSPHGTYNEVEAAKRIAERASFVASEEIEKRFEIISNKQEIPPEWNPKPLF